MVSAPPLAAQPFTAEPHTAEEYLAMDLACEGKLEYLNGVVVAMAGASPRHNLIALNLGASLRGLLRGCCTVFLSDQRVRISATDAYVYPDVSVACGALRFSEDRPRSLLNPSMVAEVLSPSTEEHDRGAKLAHYRRHPSVREVLLVSEHERRVECYRRLESKQWLITDVQPEGHCELRFLDAPAFPIALSLDDIYAGVEALPQDDR